MTEPQFDSEAGCSCGWRGASEDADDHPCGLPTFTACPFDLPDPDHCGPLDELHRDAAVLASKSTIYAQEHPKLDPVALRRVGLIPTLERHLREAAQQLVDEAREAGMTWEQIGVELGTTRQAAQMRFGKRK